MAEMSVVRLEVLFAAATKLVEDLRRLKDSDPQNLPTSYAEFERELRETKRAHTIANAKRRGGDAVDLIAYPPRGLSREEAARYIGVGASLFDQMVKDRRMPAPKIVNTRTIWDRVQLDVYFTDLPGRGSGNLVDDLIAEAKAKQAAKNKSHRS